MERASRNAIWNKEQDGFAALIFVGVARRDGRCRRSWRLALVAVCMLLAAPVVAQERLPEQAYRPSELVSFTRNVPMNTALEILSAYAQKFENRLIIDRQNRSQAIGVAVENMYWKRALEYILRSNMLKYTAHERHYEIEPLVEAAGPQAATGISLDTREIEINAVFFQADYETLYELGINWSSLYNGEVEFRTSGASNVAQEFFRVSVNKIISGTLKVDALLRAFESRSKGEILARPHIRVMEGEEGKIKVGTNFFLTLQDFAGNTRFSEYEAGIIMTVTPTIFGRRDSTFIHLDIQAERSDVQPSTVGPTKNVTESTTQVLLRNGEETVIAGLLSFEVQNQRRGIPILKDLPPWFFGLRYLFGYESKRYTRKELVIFIRARIVPPLQSRQRGRINPRAYIEYQKQDLNRYSPKNEDTRRRTRRNDNQP